MGHIPTAIHLQDNSIIQILIPSLIHYGEIHFVIIKDIICANVKAVQYRASLLQKGFVQKDVVA